MMVQFEDDTAELMHARGFKIVYTRSSDQFSGTGIEDLQPASR